MITSEKQSPSSQLQWSKKVTLIHLDLDVYSDREMWGTATFPYLRLVRAGIFLWSCLVFFLLLLGALHLAFPHVPWSEMYHYLSSNLGSMAKILDLKGSPPLLVWFVVVMGILVVFLLAIIIAGLVFFTFFTVLFPLALFFVYHFFQKLGGLFLLPKNRLHIWRKDEWRWQLRLKHSHWKGSEYEVQHTGEVVGWIEKRRYPWSKGRYWICAMDHQRGETWYFRRRRKYLIFPSWEVADMEENTWGKIKFSLGKVTLEGEIGDPSPVLVAAGALLME